MIKKNKRWYRFLKGLGYFLCGVLLVFAFALWKVCEWSTETFNVSLEEILFTITSPLKGTETGVVSQGFEYCVPTVLTVLSIYLVLIAIDCWNRTKVRIKTQIGKITLNLEVFSILRGCVIVFIMTAVGFSLYYVNQEYNVVNYIQKQIETSTIYEDYYVDPTTANITAVDGKKNLICIYLESMETTYASHEEGGQQEETYIPKLIELTKDSISFSHTEGFGGFSSIPGTYWTMAALLATTSGVPFSFPVEANSMGEHETFAGGLTTLGDVLAEQGYRQLFLCGSDAEFGGREQYFKQHGNYEIFDLYTAREKGYIPEDYYTWWGYEDKYLYEIAKEQLLEMAAGDQPFNFTMLTVDTHPVGGYVCDWCESTYENTTANVVACSDRQAYEFVEWCKGQVFYEDTAIVLIGDHLRMDTCLLENADHKNRRVYNCFINSFAKLKDESFTKERIVTTVDIFPSILAAMGFEFDGERLGLGTNMFSGEKSLAEEMDYRIFCDEISKHSRYYLKNFQ